MKPLDPETRALPESAPSSEFSFARLAEALNAAREIAQHVGPTHAAWDDIFDAEYLLQDALGLKPGQLEKLTLDLEQVPKEEGAK